MNTTRDFVRSSLSGAAAPRALPSRSTAFGLNRAGFPVVSNRAYVAAWIARRRTLVTGVVLARSH